MNDPPSATHPSLVLTGRFEPEEERRYRHVPFEVPGGLTQLHIRIDYNDQIGSSVFLSGGNTLDIGVFDEQGAHSGSPGFRGWSGSNKLALTIGVDWATPPYRPGPIGAGQWQLLLGPYKIGPNGLDYRAQIWFDPDLAEPSTPEAPITYKSATNIPEPIEPGWLRGDLHNHSVASDGDSTLPELLQTARGAGLDFLGLTDHNAAMLPHASGLDPSLPVLIPGIEVTTYKGHWNVWGADRWFDFRLLEADDVAREMAIATEAGGFVSMNHPRPFGPNWEYGFDLGYHAVEVWNGPWPFLNSVSLGIWDMHLALGRRVVAVGGSDTHFLKGEDAGPIPRARLGEPSLWVKPDDPTGAGSILAEVRAGRSFISASPQGPQLLMSRSGDGSIGVSTGAAQGLTLQLIASGRTFAATAVDQELWEWRFAFPADATHVRAQLVDAGGNIEAITNAIWR
jgi:hypothetical protein